MHTAALTFGTLSSTEFYQNRTVITQLQEIYITWATHQLQIKNCMQLWNCRCVCLYIYIHRRTPIPVDSVSAVLVICSLPQPEKKFEKLKKW